MGDQDTMMLALTVEPIGGGDWRWRWYDHDSNLTLADGVEGDVVAAWRAATTHHVKIADEVFRIIRARAEAAEQRAEALAAEVARLRAVIAEEVTELPVWPDGAYQTPAERDVSAVRAALVAALAEARPAGEVADGCRPEDGL